MRIIVAMLVVLASCPLFAQYGPPVDDLDDAALALREFAPQLERPFNEARDQAQVLNVIAKATNRLAGLKPAEEVAFGLKIIDDFLEVRERQSKPLSRENLNSLMTVRKELELQQPPYSVVALRERLHHEFVHPMEREALANKAKVETLLSLWEAFRIRNVEMFNRELMTAIREVAKEQSVQ